MNKIACLLNYIGLFDDDYLELLSEKVNHLIIDEDDENRDNKELKKIMMKKSLK